jgi:hypothetical protein
LGARALNALSLWNCAFRKGAVLSLAKVWELLAQCRRSQLSEFGAARAMPTLAAQ